MAFNGSNNQKALMRDQHGHLKGFAGGPGRPLGSRNKLTEDFLAICTPLGWSMGQT